MNGSGRRFRWAGAALAVVVTAACLLPVLPAPALADTIDEIHVDKNDPNCVDQGGNGSVSQPFCTIVAAAKVAIAGKTVIVASGTYSGQVSPNSGTATAPLVFVTAPGADVTVTQGGAKDKYGFYLTSRNYVTVRGFNVTGTTSDGVYVSKSDHISLIENHVSNSGKPNSGQTAKGIRLSNTTNSLVSGNTVDHNTDYGIYLADGSTGNTIVGNHAFANAQVINRAASGIRLYGSAANVVSSNVSHDNEDSGIELFTGSNSNIVVNNVTYNNGDHGIDTYQSTGNRHVSNSVYNNQTAGINAEGGSTGTVIRNNISVDNGIGSTRTDSNIRVDSQSTSGSSMNYDLVNLRSGTMLIWGSTKYTSLSAFKAATGQEAKGLQADPRWASPSGGDFHLLAGSPAIDSADSSAPGQPTTDADGSSRVDDPVTVNSGAGSRLFDDRGAYEFQPEVTDLPPAASLSVTPSMGTAPLKVTADASASTDTDDTPIDSYAFDFGDGTTVGPQTGPVASHTYTAAGSYTVKVTVTDTADQASTATTQVTVTVADAPPAAVLAVTPASGTAPLEVIADASASSDGDATPIDSYAFDFGDGTTVGPQTGQQASHTYTAAGSYTVKVTVTDTAGQASTATTQVTVSAPDAPPVAMLAVSPSSGVTPVVVTADADGSSDTDATPIASYTFDFGDGSAPVGPQAGKQASHTYTVGGTFTVTVTVKDTAGLSSTATRQVTVKQNLVANSGFESDTGGWNTSGSGTGVTLTRVSGAGHSGEYAAKLTNNGTAAATVLLNDSPNVVSATSAGSYTGSIWVRAETGTGAGAVLNLRFREYSGTTLVNTGTAQVTLSTSWRLVTLTYTPKSLNTSLDFNAYMPAASAPPGSYFYADDATITRE